MSNRHDDGEYTPKPDYEVGFGRPPKDTQFKPGQSGNPKGRKRRPKSVQAQMQKVLLSKVAINEGGQPKQVSLQELILRNIGRTAAKGDLKAAAFVFDLLNSPKYADTDVIDQSSLSPDDQAMFAEIMRQFAGGDSSDQASRPGEFEDECAEGES